MNIEWVIETKQRAIEYMNQRRKTNKTASIGHFMSMIIKRKGGNFQHYYGQKHNFPSIEKYEHKYNNALYFLSKIVGDKAISAFDLITAHQVVLLYYNIQFNSVRFYEKALTNILKYHVLEKNDVCYFNKNHLSASCERINEYSKQERIKKQRFELKNKYDIINYRLRLYSTPKKENICMLNICDRCKKVSSTQWIHYVYYRKPISMGNVKSRAKKEYWDYLCTGCRNKFRGLENAQIEADKNRILINKLKRIKYENIKKVR
jgi:hypothetical protein